MSSQEIATLTAPEGAEPEDRTFVVKRRARLEEYQRLAKAAFDLADHAELEHVREKHLLSAHTWQAMADAEAHRG
jgi:hypothetical protein